MSGLLEVPGRDGLLKVPDRDGLLEVVVLHPADAERAEAAERTGCTCWPAPRRTPGRLSRLSWGKFAAARLGRSG